MRPHIEIRDGLADSKRVVFLYPYKPEFAAAARALKIRGFVKFGADPIPGKFHYKAFYADINKFNAETYAAYKMLVWDFYADDIRKPFNALFPGVDHAGIEASVHNPNEYMEARRPVVEALIEKYRNTTSPLEFYGSKHMAEGIAMMLESMESKTIKGCINADEQGMAKTRQAIVTAVEHKSVRALVVAPKTPKVATWPKEIAKVDPKVRVLLANYKYLGRSAPWTLIQWDDLRLMPHMPEYIEAVRRGHTMVAQDLMLKIGEWMAPFDLLIIDEAHRAKKTSSQRTMAIMAMAEHAKKIICLTGTPLTKRPKDIVPLLRMIKHPLGKDENGFLSRYQLNATDPKAPQRFEELHSLLRDCFIRREKSQTNLPEKIRYQQKVELTEAQKKEVEKRWKAYEQENAEKMADPKYPYALVRSLKVREFVSMMKVPYVIDWAEDLLDADEKVVIFTDFTDVYEAYMKHFGSKAVGVNGAVSDKERLRAVDRFMEDPNVTVFVGNTRAAGEGITLTSASYLAFNDVTQIPTDQLQGEDRIHRGGAKSTCSVYFFLSDMDEDLDAFEAFINDKAVVQAVTNRRHEDGEIRDAKWVGEDAHILNQTLVNKGKTDFDWDDAGEEPPANYVDPNDLWRQRAMQARMKQTATEAPLFRNEATNAVLVRQLQHILPRLRGWEREFIGNLCAFYAERGFLTPKQKSKAQDVIDRRTTLLMDFGG